MTAYEPPRRFDAESRGGPVSYPIHHALEPAPAGTRLRVEEPVGVDSPCPRR